MRIDWATLCRFAEVNGNLATIVGAGIDITWAAQLPAGIQTMVAVRMTAPEDELGPEHPHTLRCRILDPDMQEVGETLEAELRAGGESLRPGWLVGIMIPMGVQWQADREGTYTVELAIDGGDPYMTPMHVLEGMPPAAQPPI